MNRVSVDSSNVASIGFDEDNLVLEVEFLNGSVYQYFDVPTQIYDGLRNAASVGAFLASQIKGHYRFSRV